VTDRATKFRREPAEKRREALILATLSLIAEQGVAGATARAIAGRAGVTLGLIRHYFSSKEDLITAAYDYHMRSMTDLTAIRDEDGETSCRSRLARFVATGLMPPVVDPRSVSLWAGFLNKVRADARMLAVHEQTYRDFRDRLQRLIADALSEAGIATTPEKLRELAIASNAVIDGLWMEGSALPGAFEEDELPRIGVAAVGTIIGLNLTQDESV